MTLLVLVTLSTIIIAAFAISDNNRSSNPEKQLIVSSNSSINITPTSVGYTTANHNWVNHSTNHIIISPEEAQKIAEKYINQPGANADTPDLVREDGKRVYIVLVVENGKKVGEIYLDAHSGENLGGCGGAP